MDNRSRVRIRRHSSIGLCLILVLSLIVCINAVSICPFDQPVPSKLTQGHYIVSKQMVGESDGGMAVSEGSTYQSSTQVNSYQFSALAIGTTQYAATLDTDVDSIQATKVIDQSATGVAQIDESYAQMAVNKSDNLSYCDITAGGSYTVMSPGQFASVTSLNRPVSLIYQVAVAGDESNNGMANGMSRVWLSVNSMEGFGNNGTYTVTAQQNTHQSVTFFGNYRYSSVDSVRISHPIAPISSSLTSLAQTFTCGS